MSGPDKKRPPVGRTTEGQPVTFGASGKESFAQLLATSKPISDGFRSSTGRTWRYIGKRGRVLAILATLPAGLTQWDTLPGHTRLGGTIHALRLDRLLIDTEREGEYRHARSWLTTPGSLLKQGKNTVGVA